MVLGLCIVLPSVAGMILACVLHSHNYLLLSQGSCYASYVSGRFAYIDLYFVYWKLKLEAWIGLNT
jgi:hypothetical protein